VKVRNNVIPKFDKVIFYLLLIHITKYDFFYSVYMLLFPEKGTKMTSKLHISKSKSLSFFKKIHINKIFHSLFWFIKVCYVTLETNSCGFYWRKEGFLILKCGVGMPVLFLSQKKSHVIQLVACIQVE